VVKIVVKTQNIEIKGLKKPVFMRFFGQDRENGTIIPKQARYQTAPR